MLIISQKQWAAGRVADLAVHLDTVVDSIRRFQVDQPIQPVVLLPLAEAAEPPPDRQAFLLALGHVAAERGLFLAGAAVVTDPSAPVPFTLGFLLGAEGQSLLESRKYSPELVNGLAVDQTSALAVPIAPSAAVTPIGQVGLLVGEDILFPHLARALVWKGAEVILNPAAEVSDDLFAARQNARTARAFENCAYIATASACGGGAGEPQAERPVASGFADWTGTRLDAQG
ncbi:MAG: nitrilase-related carbon-nitrogen hydrolase, partial [Rhodospirillaceae bacterium]|nr:nitrilase-related carbon-nitrogen hydrolase [Rhodospirillaceae bacterium]